MAYIGAQPNKQLTKTTSQSFNGTGSATAFTLNRAVNTGEELEVFVGNVQQEPGSGKSYTATGTTLTFDEAPPSGTGNVYVIYRGQAEVTTRLEAPDLSITTAKLADDAVTKAKIGATELDLATIKDSSGSNTAITIDSSGRVFKPATPAFHAYADDGNYQTTSPIPYDNTTINVGNAFDTSNYKYVVPVSGNYFIAVHFGIVRDDASGGESLNIELKKNGTRIQRGYFEEVSSTGYGNISFSAIHALAAGDELTVTAGGGVDYFAAAADTIFSGYLIG